MTVLTRSASRQIGREWWWKHPEIPALVVVSGAWVFLVAHHFRNHGEANDAWRFEPEGWLLMTVAMMVPATLPMVRRLSFDSVWTRRHRGPTIFLTVYVVCWFFAGLAGAALVEMASNVAGWEPGFGRVAVLLALVVAGVWQFREPKLKAVRRCHLRYPIPPRGWEAEQATLIYGVKHWLSCAVACGPIMVVMLISGHNLHLMVPLSVATIVDRYQRIPSPQAGAIGIGVALLSVPLM